MLQKTSKKDDTEFCGVILYEIKVMCLATPIKITTKAKTWNRWLIPPSTWRAYRSREWQMKMPGMRAGVVSPRSSTMADTLKAIYRRWVGTDFVRDEYARLASEEVQNVKYILRELERVAYEPWALSMNKTFDFSHQWLKLPLPDMGRVLRKIRVRWRGLDWPLGIFV